MERKKQCKTCAYFCRFYRSATDDVDPNVGWCCNRAATGYDKEKKLTDGCRCHGETRIQVAPIRYRSMSG